MVRRTMGRPVGGNSGFPRRNFLLGAAAIILPTATGKPVRPSADNWPQPAGPNGNWTAKGKAPVRWSVTRSQNIVWRTTLPEAGQGNIAVWGDRLFLTTMKPLPAADAKKEGAEAVGYCLDARTGKILWTVDLPGSEPATYAYGFSDSTTPGPVTDGKRVWFFNASGSVGCYDFAGRQLWQRVWKPTSGRPFNKQFKPFLVGNTLVTMEPRDDDDPRREKDPWNYLRGLNADTGKTLWVADDALTHYNTPGLGYRKDGTPAVLQGRGGYHDVPETPIGLTLTSLAPGSAGKTLWRFPTTGKALYNMSWDSRYAYWLDQDNACHLVLDAETGTLLRTQSLTQRVDYRRHDPTTGRYILESDIDLTKRARAFRVFPAWFTNIVVSGWHYFLCFTDAGEKVGPPYCVGRVNVETGKAEYLELPVQIKDASGKPDTFVWNAPQTTSTINARGIDAAGDPRSRRDGWYWNFLPAPIALDGKIYYTTMLGVTYVLDGRAKVLDEKALLAVNDLGPAGQTWSLNTVSCANGRLYHRSMKEVVCIGK